MLKRCQQLVRDAHRRLEAKDRAQQAFIESENKRMAESLQLDAEVPGETEPLPEALIDGHVRHDNDKLDFRLIRVLPTASEVLCEKPSYLPRQSAHFLSQVSIK